MASPSRERHALQGGNLPEELLPRLGGAADHSSARGYVRHHARLCRNPGTLADVQVPGYARLPTDLHEVAEHRRASDADLRHDDAAAADTDVVRDLDEVIQA